MYMYLYVQESVQKHTYSLGDKLLYIQVYTHARTHTHVHTHAHMCACARTHAHTHTHTHTAPHSVPLQKLFLVCREKVGRGV